MNLSRSVLGSARGGSAGGWGSQSEGATSGTLRLPRRRQIANSNVNEFGVSSS